MTQFGFFLNKFIYFNSYFMTMRRDGIVTKNYKFDHRSWVRFPKKCFAKISEISEAEMRI